MERDMDLVRALLLEIEKQSDGERWLDNIEIDGYSRQQITYHLKLLWEAGLVDANDKTTTLKSGLSIVATGLTWEGHEFLDASRNEGNWNKAKNFLSNKVGTLTFEGIKATLNQIIKSQIPDIM